MKVNVNNVSLVLKNTLNNAGITAQITLAIILTNSINKITNTLLKELFTAKSSI